MIFCWYLFLFRFASVRVARTLVGALSENKCGVVFLSLGISCLSADVYVYVFQSHR